MASEDLNLAAMQRLGMNGEPMRIDPVALSMRSRGFKFCKCRNDPRKIMEQIFLWLTRVQEDVIY
jgi:hypothetical protein